MILKLGQFLENDYDDLDHTHKEYQRSHALARQLHQNLKKKNNKKLIKKLNKLKE